MVNARKLVDSTGLPEEVFVLWGKHCELMFAVYEWLPGADNALLGMVYIVLFAHIFFGAPLSKIAGAKNMYDWRYIRVNWPSIYYFCLFLGVVLVFLLCLPYILWRYPDLLI